MLTLTELDVYGLVIQTPDMKFTLGLCALQQKQYPDGLLKHLKVRYCARGFKQIEGVDYSDTYSPIDYVNNRTATTNYEHITESQYYINRLHCCLYSRSN